MCPGFQFVLPLTGIFVELQSAKLLKSFAISAVCQLFDLVLMNMYLTMSLREDMGVQMSTTYPKGKLLCLFKPWGPFVSCFVN